MVCMAQSMFLTRFEQVNGRLAQVEIKCLIHNYQSSSSAAVLSRVVLLVKLSVGHNVLSAVFSQQPSREI